MACRPFWDFFVVVFDKNAFDMEHWIIGALWEMEVSRLMAAIVYLLPQLPTNYHYSMLMHEIKLYYQSTLTACLGPPKGQREVLSSPIYMYCLLFRCFGHTKFQVV